MSEFKREERYIVVKIKDIGNPELERKLRHMISHEIKAPTIECVIIESDWPIYEQVWDMVQRLDEGREQEIDVLKRQVEFLSQRAEQLNNGHDYLMTVSPDELTVEDALEAFGYNSNGMRLA